MFFPLRPVLLQAFLIEVFTWGSCFFLWTVFNRWGGRIRHQCPAACLCRRGCTPIDALATDGRPYEFRHNLDLSVRPYLRYQTWLDNTRSDLWNCTGGALRLDEQLDRFPHVTPHCLFVCASPLPENAAVWKTLRLDNIVPTSREQPPTACRAQNSRASPHSIVGRVPLERLLSQQLAVRPQRVPVCPSRAQNTFVTLDLWGRSRPGPSRYQIPLVRRGLDTSVR